MVFIEFPTPFPFPHYVASQVSAVFRRVRDRRYATWSNAIPSETEEGLTLSSRTKRQTHHRKRVGHPYHVSVAQGDRMEEGIRCVSLILLMSFAQSSHFHFAGDIVYLDALGSRILFLNSYEAAEDLMERRSTIYSGRPVLMMLNKLCESYVLLAFNLLLIYFDF